MSKRKQRREQGAAWMEEDENKSSPQSLQEITAQGYGLNIAPSHQRVVARPISIFEIHPDPAQPRRTIPSAIRAIWNGHPGGIKKILMVWWGEVQRERGQAVGAEELPFELGAYLEGGATERARDDAGDYSVGPLEASFMKIIMLAASIRRDGLTNPITAATMPGNQYRLETGERRWLAYHLLHAWFDGHGGRPDESARWETIPTRIVDNVDVWRQASENNARDNLNAVGKARQYAVLMMDLHGMDKFQPIGAFASEREYYAQAGNLATPTGRREELLNALGVSSPSVLTRLRGLLKLPDEIWQGGDDYDLPEDMLDSLYQIARKDPQKAIDRYRALILNQNMDGEKPNLPPTSQVAEPGSKRHFSFVLRSVKNATPGNDDKNKLALRSLRELREWIDAEEDRIATLLDDK